MTDHSSRRAYLRYLAAAGTLGLAGCSESDSGEQDGNLFGTETPGPTATATEQGDTPAAATATASGDTETASEETETATEADPQSAGRTIRLGMLMGVSGGLEQLGPPIRDAAALVPRQVTDADTEFAVDTQFEDTGTDPGQGVRGAQALVEAGYPMICGALASQVSLQVAQQAAVPGRVTMCSPTSSSSELTSLADDGFFFRTIPTAKLQGAVLAQIAARRRGHDTAAVLFLDDGYGRELRDGFADTFAARYGGTLTGAVRVTPGQSSYSAALGSALDDDPDALVVVAYPNVAVPLFRDFYSDFDPGATDVLVSGQLRDPSLPDQVGADMSNVYGAEPTERGPGAAFVDDLYRRTHQRDPADAFFLRYAYDAVAVLVLANAAAGENDGPAVRDNMQAVTEAGGDVITPGSLVEGIELAAEGRDIEYRGASGPLEFDSNGDIDVADYEYFQFTRDGVRTLDTIRT